MAEGLILEFEEIGEAEYQAVNAKLGIDMASGTGDWPSGLLVHTAGISDSGTFVVAEVWASRADQERFMSGRLGAALAAAGVSAPSRLTWVPLLAFHKLAG